MTYQSFTRLLTSISFVLILSQTLNAQIFVLDTVRFVRNIDTPFKTDKANQVTQFPFSFSGFKETDTIVDLDFYIQLKSIYTNSNEIALISPFGVRAVVLTTNSCPFQIKDGINAVFNDQAYDINMWKNFQILSPAFFNCTSTETIVQTRPQADHLKVFKASKLKLLNNNYKFTIHQQNIDPLNNTFSGPEIEELLSLYDIQVDSFFTLKYDNFTQNPITGLEQERYYVFKCVDNQTITFEDPNLNITDIMPGSTHTFERNNTWIIEISNNDPLITGSLVRAGLFISYYTDQKTKGSISNDTLQADTGGGGMKINNNENFAIEMDHALNPFGLNGSDNTNAYISNNPLLTGIPAVLNFKQTNAQARRINILNSYGALLSSHVYDEINSTELTLPAFQGPGLYIIQILEGNSTTSLKLVVQ